MKRSEFAPLNKRRHELIVKKHSGGLTTEETKELRKLQDVARRYANKVAPLPKTVFFLSLIAAWWIVFAWVMLYGR